MMISKKEEKKKNRTRKEKKETKIRVIFKKINNYNI